MIHIISVPRSPSQSLPLTWILIIFVIIFPCLVKLLVLSSTQMHRHCPCASCRAARLIPAFETYRPHHIYFQFPRIFMPWFLVAFKFCAMSPFDDAPSRWCCYFCWWSWYYLSEYQVILMQSDHRHRAQAVVSTKVAIGGCDRWWQGLMKDTCDARLKHCYRWLAGWPAGRNLCHFNGRLMMINNALQIWPQSFQAAGSA